MEEVLKKCNEIKEELSKERYHEFNLGVIVDDRNYKPGFKYNHWELRGVPLRLEIGPRDLQNKQIVLVRRDNGQKTVIKMHDIAQKAKESLDEVQKNLYNNF